MRDDIGQIKRETTLKVGLTHDVLEQCTGEGTGVPGAQLARLDGVDSDGYRE